MIPATRTEALSRLETFLPRAASAYSRDRNYDRGPRDRTNVSVLSPYIRHRLVTEAEVVRAVLGRHRISAAEKFVEEICWRTYWKGWLEHRPSIWTAYLDELNFDRASVARQPERRDMLADAERGTTGIAAFDIWSRELAETGYLHNHARMWFASIWIFTLGLPWTLGADYFYRHLLDGDPASNTLSWRWVAGLHTPGKHYVAEASNIRKFTDGRFDVTGELNETPAPLDGAAIPEASRLRTPLNVAPDTPVVLLVGENDLAPESLPLAAKSVKAVAILPPDTTYRDLAPNVVAFRMAALDDAAARAERAFKVPVVRVGEDAVAALRLAARKAGTDRMVIAEVPVGPARTTIDDLVSDLAGTGLTLSELRRPWDAAFWPHAKRGFFQLKSRIPETLERLEML
ncbi:MAG: FAD-binding domain-containing protein [Hyphomicrobium sp.]|nr:FAD-binding domain-containing protein [Hyphomicrobium sp.]